MRPLLSTRREMSMLVRLRRYWSRIESMRFCRLLANQSGSHVESVRIETRGNRPSLWAKSLSQSLKGQSQRHIELAALR